MMLAIRLSVGQAASRAQVRAPPSLCAVAPAVSHSFAVAAICPEMHAASRLLGVREERPCDAGQERLPPGCWVSPADAEMPPRARARPSQVASEEHLKRTSSNANEAINTQQQEATTPPPPSKRVAAEADGGSPERNGVGVVDDHPLKRSHYSDIWKTAMCAAGRRSLRLGPLTPWAPPLARDLVVRPSVVHAITLRSRSYRLRPPR